MVQHYLIEATFFILSEGITSSEPDDWFNLDPSYDDIPVTDVRYVVTGPYFHLPDPPTKEKIEECITAPHVMRTFIADQLSDFLMLPNTRGIVRLCGRENLDQVTHLLDELAYWKKRGRSYPNQELVELRILFLQRVFEQFKAWFAKHGFDVMDLRSVSEQLGLDDIQFIYSGGRMVLKTDGQVITPPPQSGSSTQTPSNPLSPKLNNRPAQRIILSPSKMEEFNQSIVDAVEEFVDQGLGTLEQAFYAVAADSVRKLGIPVTKGAIEGRYKRYKDRR